MPGSASSGGRGLPDRSSKHSGGPRIDGGPDSLDVYIALTYGGGGDRGRYRRSSRRLSPEDVDERTFASYLYAPTYRGRLVIRTSGELRVSNFLLGR